jgi:tetratricopeptide (TPR) repeat protein
LRQDLQTRGRLPIRECLEIGISLAAALAHLHQQGLVHRDIKPSNVLFVGGVPKLGDIGLVTQAGDTQSIVGTEGYIPPEGPGTPQADIYSLGKVLYELSTGMDRRHYPELPTDMRFWRDYAEAREFNDIVLKACASHAQERYQTAEEIADELRLLESGASVRRTRRYQRGLAAVKRVAPGLAVAALTALLVLFANRKSANVTDPATAQTTAQFASSYPKSPIPEVNELVGEGNYAVRGGRPEKLGYAERCFNEAIKRDPNFVPAYYGLTGVEIRLLDEAGRMERLREIAQAMHQLAPNSAEALQTSAFLKWRDRKYQEALQEAASAARAPALCQEGRAWSFGAYGFFLQNTGSPTEAEAQYQRGFAEWNDPTLKDHIGHPYFMRGRLSEAMRLYQASVAMEPNHPNGLNWIARTYEEMKQFDNAIDAWQHHDEATDSHPVPMTFYGDLRAAVRADPVNGYWRKRLEYELQHHPDWHYWIATHYAHLNDMKRAYEQLELADAHNDSALENLLFDLCWDRNDPWFKAFAKKIGLSR